MSKNLVLTAPITYSKNDEQEKVEEKEIEVAQINSPKNDQPRFPLDPYSFTPTGLVRRVYPGTHNGAIIKWSDPITGAVIFEWNEDKTYGPHYHVMLPSANGKHDGEHYFAGDLIPDPWKTIYFGGQ